VDPSSYLPAKKAPQASMRRRAAHAAVLPGEPGQVLTPEKTQQATSGHASTGRAAGACEVIYGAAHAFELPFAFVISALLVRTSRTRGTNQAGGSRCRDAIAADDRP